MPIAATRPQPGFGLRLDAKGLRLEAYSLRLAKTRAAWFPCDTVWGTEMTGFGPLPPFKGLIFDCDGTLVISAGLHLAAFDAALSRQGLVMEPQWYAARTGLARRDLLGALQSALHPGLDLDRAIADSIAATLGASAACRPNPPVVALARSWHGRVPMAVASNAEGPVMRAMLDACDLTGLFNPLISLDDVSAPKPDPAMFLLAALRMELAPQDCLVLEDSDQGLSAAAAAGMAALDVRS